VDVHLTGTPAVQKTWCRHLGRSGAGANEGGNKKASKEPKMQVQFNELFELKIPQLGSTSGWYTEAWDAVRGYPATRFKGLN